MTGRSPGRSVEDVKAVRAVVVVGLLLLALGFAVGTEPRQHDGRSCGSVLLFPLESATMPHGCPTRAGGAAWLGTWLPLTVGGLLLVVGTTAWRERTEAQPRRVRP